MEIRYINENDDFFQISNIYEESWKYAYKGIIPQNYLDNLPVGKWVNHLSKPNMRSLVIIDKDQYIGTTSFCKSRFLEFQEYGELVSLYLLPEYIGKGYGYQLLDAAVTELKKEYNDIFLWVLEENYRARKFYERNGWSFSMKYLEDNIGGKELREVQYRFHIN